MDKMRLTRLLVVLINVLCCFLLFHAIKKPDCARAQTQCIDPNLPLLNNVVISSGYGDQNSGSNIELGCFNYCAVEEAYGVDNSLNQGFTIISTPSCPTSGTTCASPQLCHEVFNGNQVDSWGIRCFNIN